jgi:hypothetical protein
MMEVSTRSAGQHHSCYSGTQHMSTPCQTKYGAASLWLVAGDGFSQQWLF